MSGLKKNPRNGGFLLFELMVAVIVISISLTAISRSFIHSLSVLQQTTSFLEGDLLLEKKMWELENESKLVPGEEEGVFEEWDERFWWKVAITEKEPPLSLLEARVTVGWGSGNRERTLTATRYFQKADEKE